MARVYELLAKDCPNFVFVFQPATTFITPTDSNNLFLNDTKYRVFDHSYREETPDFLEYRSLAQFRNLALFSGRVRVYKSAYGNYPPTELVTHWQEKLHGGATLDLDIRDSLNGDPEPHYVFFPLEKLQHHAVDPDVLYEVSSKAFIASVDCPQAATVDPAKPTFPCMMKLLQSRGGRGTFLLHNANEYRNKVEEIRRNMPCAEFVLTGYVRNVQKNYATQMHMNRAGDVTWFGAAEQFMDSRGQWDTAIARFDDQTRIKATVYATLKPLLRAMHEKGFFGYVSIDVLVDDKDKTYVVDVNPRFSAESVIVYGVREFASKGYTTGIMASWVKLKGPLSAILDKLKTIKDGEIVVIVATTGEKTVVCELAIFGDSYDRCLELLEECKQKCS